MRPDPAPGFAHDATALLQGLADGRFDAQSLIERHLARLAETRPSLNAATEILDAEARAEAARPRPGPLSGLPVSVKETYALAGRSLTGGSLRMTPIECDADAAAVARLRAAGAIVLARGNVPELAMAAETENPRYGRTDNPLAPGRTCGGSSGGDAALVASGGVVAGLGSDILGSIRIPSAFCGLVGFKPAADAIPKAGMWPELGELFANSWLAAGPITRTVRDARLFYSVLADRPPAAPASPRGLRLIHARDFPWHSRDGAIPVAMEASRGILRDAGLKEEARSLGDVGRWSRAMAGILGYELLPEMRRALAGPDGRRFSLARESLRRLVGRGTIYAGLFHLLLLAPLVRYRRSETVARGIELIEAGRRQVREILADDGVVLLPTIGTLAPPHGVMNRLSFRPGMNRLMTPTSLCNYLDLPAVTVPAWRYRDASTGLVPGVMLAAAPGAEGPLLDAAAALERGLLPDADNR